MRHRKATHNFARTPAHRKAMLRNLVLNLIAHGRIRTTVQKAKAARSLMDRVITLGKRNTLHTRRQAISLLGSTLSAKRAVRKVFGELAGQYATRPGGYTRILRLPAIIRQAKADRPRGRIKNLSKLYGSRLGDNADMVLWELCGAETTKKTKQEKKAVEKTENPTANESANAEPQGEKQAE